MKKNIIKKLIMTGNFFYKGLDIAAYESEGKYYSIDFGIGISTTIKQHNDKTEAVNYANAISIKREKDNESNYKR
jgi:hypothetical protein